MSNSEIEVGPCDVCVLLDGDERLWPDVTWCDRCQAWICPRCRADWWRRFRAMVQRKLNGVYV